MEVCSAHRVPETEVLAVPEPSFTRTWHPIGHGTLIRALLSATENYGWKIASRSYSLSLNKTKMFGVWELETEIKGKNWTIGFRNSIDKSMAVGLVAGLKVFVCDNLVFSGEFIEFRKHTAGLNQQTLENFCIQAINQIEGRLIETERWVEGLKKIPLSVSGAEHLTIQAMRNGIIPINQFNSFYNLYFSPEGRWFSPDSNLYQWHSACTELMKGDSLFLISKKNAKLISLLSEEEFMFSKPSFLFRILQKFKKQ